VFEGQSDYKGPSLIETIQDRDSLCAIDAKQERLNLEYKELISQARELNLELHGISDKTELLTNLYMQNGKQEKMIANREALFPPQVYLKNAIFGNFNKMY